MSYQVRSTNPDTGLSHVCSGGPYDTRPEAERAAVKIQAEEMLDARRSSRTPLRITIEPTEET